MTRMVLVRRTGCARAPGAYALTRHRHHWRAGHDERQRDGYQPRSHLREYT